LHEEDANQKTQKKEEQIKSALVEKEVKTLFFIGVYQGLQKIETVYKL